MSFTTMTIGDLCVSPYNARINRHDAESVDGMAGSLLNSGQLYPLIVHPMSTKKGAPKQWGVFAGGRRYRAFRMLIDSGRLPADHPIEVIVRDITDEAELVALSLAENLVRLGLRTYEVYTAVVRAHERGRSLQEIADTNGQPVTTIRQWIRLGRLHPAIFAALEQEEIATPHAMAFAATEDHQLQLRTFEQFMQLSLPQRRDKDAPTVIRRMLKIGDSELTKMLRFVGEKAYADAGGRYELDLFAEQAEERGRIVDEGLLMQLADAKLERVRDLLRRQAGRDLRFEREYPRDPEFGGVARDLEIAAEPVPLAPADAERLAFLQNEMTELEAKAQQILDAPDLEEEQRASLIAAIDVDYEPMESEVAEIGDRMLLHLPQGDIFGTMIVQQDGSLETRFWWASRKEKRKALAAEQKNAATPAKPTAVSAGPIARPATPEITPAFRPTPMTGGRAIDASYGFGERQKADAAIKEEHGLTSEGVQIMRAIRRETLRAGIVQDADELEGILGQDFVIWSLARYELSGGYGYELGARRLSSGYADRSDQAAAHVQRTEAHRIWQAALGEVKVHPSMTGTDLALAFDAFHNETYQFRRMVGAIVAGLMLERSLNAGGYQVPLHDQLAFYCGLDDAAELRRLVEPTEELVDLFSKARRIAMARPLAPPVASASWEKLKAGELTSPVTRALKAAKHWVHPLLRFGEDEPAHASEEEMAQ